MRFFELGAVLPTREQVREMRQPAALTIVLPGSYAPQKREREDAIMTI
jgi:hypothetical protein